MTGLSELGPVQQASAQRRAAARLAGILDEHRGLPLVVWTVGMTGASLVGHVNAIRPAAAARAAFDAWCAALAVTDRVQAACSLGGAQLWASVDVGGVRVSITAAMFGDDEDGWLW